MQRQELDIQHAINAGDLSTLQQLIIALDPNNQDAQKTFQLLEKNPISAIKT